MEVKDIIIISAAAVLSVAVFIAVVWLFGGYGILFLCCLIAGLMQ